MTSDKTWRSKTFMGLPRRLKRLIMFLLFRIDLGIGYLILRRIDMMDRLIEFL